MNQFASWEQAERRARERNPYNETSRKLHMLFLAYRLEVARVPDQVESLPVREQHALIGRLTGYFIDEDPHYPGRLFVHSPDQIIKRGAERIGDRSILPG
jgi:hypothetical protein